jgi:hypothetical protein
MENPLLDALDQLTAEVSACRAAIEANRPEAMTQAVERAAGRVARDVGIALEKHRTDAHKLSEASVNVLEASETARTASSLVFWCLAPTIIVSAILGASAGLWAGKRILQVSLPEQGSAEACQLVRGTLALDPKSKQQFCMFWMRQE